MKIRSLCLLFAIMLLAISNTQIGYAQSISVNDIDSYIVKEMEKAKIPGMAIAVIKNNTEYVKGYGTSEGNAIHKNTLFELGSNSKAFTGLALLQLAEEGKVDLADNVSKYLPWFKVYYNGSPKEIKLEELLHHTSGVPESSITQIPVNSTSDALYQTISQMVPMDLGNEPGNYYEYATINYDIIGLIIQQVSGLNYEDYMKQNIFKPLNLTNTFTASQLDSTSERSSGHKLGFFKSVPYEGPVYRGNTPAAYIWSSASDMNQWMKVQLGMVSHPPFESIINQSHSPDIMVSNFADASSYAAGWKVYSFNGKRLEHDGANPGFSSYVSINPEKNMGITVLSNLNSGAAFSIAMGIEQILLGNEPAPSGTDFYIIINQIMLIIMLVSLIVIAIIVTLFIKGAISKSKKQRVLTITRKSIAKIIILIVCFATYSVCIYLSPQLLYKGYPWKFIQVWAPSSVVIGFITLFVAGLFCFIYFAFISFFPKNKTKKASNNVLPK